MRTAVGRDTFVRRCRPGWTQVFATLLLAATARAAAQSTTALAQPPASPPPAALLHVVGQIDGLPRTLAWHDGVLLAGLGRTLAAFDVAPDGRATRRFAGASSPPRALGGPITGLWLDGDRAYARVGSRRIEIVDIADIARSGDAQRLGVIELREARDILPLGARLWVIDGGQLVGYDVTDPRAPVRRGEVAAKIALTAIGGRDGRLVATGNAMREGPFDPYAYIPVVAATIDTRDVDAPRVVAELVIGSSGYGSHTWTAAIEVTGDVATIVSGHGIGIGFAGIRIGNDSQLGIRGIDVADPAQPAPITYPSGASGTNWWVDGVVATGPASPTGPERVFVAVRRRPQIGSTRVAQSLLAFDLRAPLSPTMLVAELPSVPVALAASADRVAAADISGTLRTFDAPPGAPPALRGADVLVDATGIAVDDDAGIAVVSHHGRGVQLVDVTEPASPRVLGEVRTPGGADGANAVAFIPTLADPLAGDAASALVADGPAGLVVVSGIMPGGLGTPHVAANLAAAGDARALAVVGAVAYSVGRAGLAVVDVGQPLSPTVLGRMPEVGPAHAIAVAAGTAFIATDAGAVAAVDVRDPAAPVQLGAVDGVPATHGLTADGDAVYAAAGSAGLIVLDARTRTIRASLETYDRVLAVDVADGTAFVACPDGGLRLADVRDPAAPQWMAAVELPGVGDHDEDALPAAVVQTGGRVYVAAHDAGVLIVTAAIGGSIRRAFLPVAMRGYRHTGASDIACGPGDGVVRQPAASPDGRWVVCTDGAALYRSPVDGGTSEAIDFGPLAVSGVDTPVFDPHSQRILFGCAVDFGIWNVCDVGVEGGDATDLTRGIRPDDWEELRPSPSPDGRYLAFDAADRVDDDPAHAPDASDIYVLDRRSGALRRLTDHPAADRFPSFFPDGRTILFRSERDGNSELYAVGVDGLGLRRLTNHPAFDAYGTVSPDGRRIAFQSSRSGNDDIYVMDVAANDAGPAQSVTDGLRAYREPRFSADGRALVLRAYDLRAYEDYAAANDPYRRHSIVQLPLPITVWP